MHCSACIPYKKLATCKILLTSLADFQILTFESMKSALCLDVVHEFYNGGCLGTTCSLL